jgi:hypothetical protein
MISLRMHHRQFGTQQYTLSAQHLERIPPTASEEQRAAALARLMRLAPRIEAGWEFEIQGAESLQEAV